MRLNLTRPIIFFDIESTGLSVSHDRIIELSLVKQHPDGRTEIRTQRFNPTIHISEEASSVHGIYDQDVKDEPTFAQQAADLALWMKDCDFAGYNSFKFDLPLLAEEFLRAGVDFDFRKSRMIDVQNIFHKKEQRNLRSAYSFYCGKEFEDDNDPQEAILAMKQILDSQIGRYSGEDGIGNDVKSLSEFCANTRSCDYSGRIGINAKGQAVFNFGKYKDKSVAETFAKDWNYFNWLMDSDFPLDTKEIFRNIYMESKKR